MMIVMIVMIVSDRSRCEITMNLLDIIGCDTTLHRVASTHGGEYAGPCPWCGGRDRFRGQPHADRLWYWCRQCGCKGDAIQYLRDRQGLTYREACARVGRSLDASPPFEEAPPPRPPRLAVPPSAAWQDQGRGFCEAAQTQLWGPKGAAALAYLHRRGLTDDTIHAARLGSHGVEMWEKPQRWGLAADQRKIWLPPGIVFPWLVGSDLWRISIRRVDDTVGKAQRYVVVSGSSNTLYGLDTLKPNAPAMIVEGLLDALSVLQEAGDLLAVVATGSTTGGRLERWIGRLSLASTVLVSLDADAAGEQASAWWLQALGPRAKRWRSYWGDPNQMLQDGVDLRTWVREGLGDGTPWWREVARWSKARRDAWAERGAILEVEGGLVRDEAERQAFALIVQGER